MKPIRRPNSKNNIVLSALQKVYKLVCNKYFELTKPVGHRGAAEVELLASNFPV